MNRFPSGRLLRPPVNTSASSLEDLLDGPCHPQANV
jgi:hypothetical protein